MAGKQRIITPRERLPVPVADLKMVQSFRRDGAISDTLYNLATGMGTAGKDKGFSTRFGFTEIPKNELDNAYRGDWVSRKIVDIPAYDATRNWRSWQSDAADITKIEDVEKKLMVRKKTMMGLIRSRLYGGGALVIGVDDQQTPDTPLEIEKLGQDCLKWVHPVSRHELTAGPIDWDLQSPYFGTPAYYTRSLQAVSASATLNKEQMQAQARMNAAVKNSGMIKLHPSRIVRFVGLECPEWNMSQGWGDSVLNIVADAVLSFGTVSSALTQLIHEAKLDIVKIPELSERISNAAYEQRLSERFSTANLMKSLYSILLLDREEEWSRVEQTFTGMPEIMQAFALMTCAAADIPATRFLGQSAQGLNATGEGDQRNYYDKVQTGQELEIQPPMETLDKVIAISALGKYPDGLFYNWNPLWQMDEAQRAEIAVKQATVMSADVAAGLLDPMVLQKARENQLIESGFYPGIEQIIADYGTDIDTREPAPGAVPPVAKIDPETGKAPDPNDPDAMARAIDDPNAPPPNPDPFGNKKPANENDPPQKKTGTNDAISQMSARIRDAITDATTPRTLYVYRPVLNFADIAKHYKDQGVENVVTNAQHVTIMYSSTPVDWLKIGNDYWGSTDEEGRTIIKPGGPRVMEKFGNHLVLAFASSDLSYRHCSILERTGGTWDYEDYTPHVSISKEPGAIDIRSLDPWTGPIVLGPEEFEEIKPDDIANAQEGKLTDGLVAIIDAIRNMPPPQVHVTVKGGRVIKEEITIQHDANGRAVGANKVITEQAED